MIIKMTDINPSKLIKRVEEKLEEGYEVVTKMHRDKNTGVVKDRLQKWVIQMKIPENKRRKK